MKISNGEDFELFCRDVLEDLDIKILSHPSRGPDQNKDMTIAIDSKDNLQNISTYKYIVQCKHNAKSKKSVSSSDVGNWQSACDLHNVDGYFLITSTTPTTNLNSEFLAVKNKGSYKTLIWDKIQLERCPNRLKILTRYGLNEDQSILSEYAKKSY